MKKSTQTPVHSPMNGKRLGAELFRLSCMTLAVAGVFPRNAPAQTVPVPTANSVATLAQAFNQDPAGSTVVLTAEIDITGASLFVPGPVQGMTIDARAFGIVGFLGWGTGSLDTANVTLLGTYQGAADTTGTGGGSALSVSHGTITNNGSITGGASTLANAGTAVQLTGGVFVNNGTITGGAASSATGSGGIGLSMGLGTNGFVNLTNNGTIQGGSSTGHGGGAGVSLGTLGGVVLTNTGTIRGGSDVLGTTTGGAALQIRASTGGTNNLSNFGTLVGGKGAAAISATGAFSLINSGSIQAGAGQADAIHFTSGTGALTLELDAGSTISGNVVANAASTSNALILGGTANSIFDVSSIGSTAQYQNFNTFSKTGSSTWALIGTATSATPWVIQQGTLQIGNGGTSGSLIGAITDNATLAFDRSDTFTFGNAISGTGAVNQVGTGTTVLDGTYTYTGGTNVLAGALAVGDATHTSATLGTGLTTVGPGGTLGGYGIVPGAVNNSGTIAVANALQAFASGTTGSFHIGGDLTNAGVVNLAAASGQIGNVLNVAGNYVGQNGQVTLNAVLNTGGSASQADQLVIGGNASGTTAVKVLRAGGAGALTVGDGIPVVQVNGTSAANSFRLAGAVQAGAYQYLLYQGGTASANDWYLRSLLEANTADATTTPAGSATNAAVAYRPGVVGYSMTPQLNADYGFAALGRLQERTGDVASLEAAQSSTGNGIWGRLDGQNLDANAGDRFSADEHTFFAQFGKDWTLARGSDGGTTHAGATLTFGSTSASFNDSARSMAGLADSTGTVETQAQTIGGYWTKYLPDGSYFDSVGQLTHYQNRYGDNAGDSGSQNGFGTALSGEVGKPFSLGSTGVAIEPQAQLVYQYLHLNHFDDGISDVGANTTNGLRGRLGFRLFKANLSNDTNTATLTPQFTADVVHDFFSAGQTTVGGTTFEEQLGKTWYDLGLGITGRFGERSELYANIKYEHSMGGEYRRNVFGQAGYRYSW